MGGSNKGGIQGKEEEEQGGGKGEGQGFGRMYS